MKIASNFISFKHSSYFVFIFLENFSFQPQSNKRLKFPIVTKVETHLFSANVNIGFTLKENSLFKSKLDILIIINRNNFNISIKHIYKIYASN